jgi:glycosyltransferase involved in cell wall biosynthesis
MKIRLIHIASSYQMGLTNQETQLALAYKSVSEIDSMVVTGECEQYEGSFELLKNNGIANKIIIGFDVHHDFIRLIKEFLSIAEEFKPDIVTVNTNWQLVVVGFAKLFSTKKFKIVYTIHGFRHNSRLKSVVARYLIGALLLIFADVINSLTVYVKNRFSFLRQCMESIPLGEDEIFFKHSAPPDFSKPLNFIFPAVFRAGKNQEMLISAFSEYLKLTKDMQGKLFLPGEGELRNRAMKLASDLGIAGRVEFPGQLNRQEMLDMYLQCQVAIVPSNDETFGHCIAEPLVMQRIVVSRNVGLAPDFLVNGENGFLFEGRDELVQCMLGIHAMSQTALLKISEAAGVTGESFRWKNIAVKNCSELFEPLLENS